MSDEADKEDKIKHPISMCPHTTLCRLLVHPKDKVKVREQGEVVYRIPCWSCSGVYINEMGGLLQNHVDEHRKDFTIILQLSIQGLTGNYQRT